METLILENKSIANNFFNLINKRSFLEMELIWAENHQLFFCSNSIPFIKKEKIDFINKLFLGFPDFNFIIQDEISEGDKIFFRGQFIGTHQGEFQGIKKTGKKIKISWMMCMEILGAKITYQWLMMDLLSLMKQIGAVPYQINEINKF